MSSSIDEARYFTDLKLGETNFGISFPRPLFLGEGIGEKFIRRACWCRGLQGVAGAALLSGKGLSPGSCLLSGSHFG
jgi:hypothetical protein